MKAQPSQSQGHLSRDEATSSAYRETSPSDDGISQQHVFGAEAPICKLRSKSSLQVSPRTSLELAQGLLLLGTRTHLAELSPVQAQGGQERWLHQEVGASQDFSLIYLVGSLPGSFCH